MRRPLHGDAISVARVLLGTRPDRRRWVLARLFREADLAHGRVRRKGSAHPVWGDGSLMTAALRRHPRAEPGLDNADYCRCLAMTFEALAIRGRQPCAQETQVGAVGSRSSRALAISSPQS